MNPDHADHDTNDMPRAVEHALRKHYVESLYVGCVEGSRPRRM
jgi:hypothetical protein